MEKVVRPNHYFLQYLSSIVNNRVKLIQLLRITSDNEIKAILELIGNFKQGNFSFRIKDGKKLKAYEGELDSLWDDKTEIKSKRRKLIRNIRCVQLLVKTATHFINSLTHV